MYFISGIHQIFVAQLLTPFLDCFVIQQFSNPFFAIMELKLRKNRFLKKLGIKIYFISRIHQIFAAQLLFGLFCDSKFSNPFFAIMGLKLRKNSFLKKLGIKIDFISGIHQIFVAQLLIPFLDCFFGFPLQYFLSFLILSWSKIPAMNSVFFFIYLF